MTHTVSGAAIAPQRVPTKSANALRFALLIAATVAITFYRRPDQFLHPYMWVEDVAMNIHDYYAHGWLSLFQPYPSYIGYFAFPARLLFAIAATLSFRWMPELGVTLAVAFQCFVVAAIAFSPTQLRHRFLCALCVLLVPIDAEVFGVSLYSGWWGSLLALLPLVWRDETTRRERAWRLAFLIIGGFSSPLIIALAPVYVVKCYFDRRKNPMIDAVVACVVVAIQVIAISFQTIHLDAAHPLSLSAVRLLVEKFFGYFLYVHPTGELDVIAFAVGLGLLLVVFGVSIAGRRRLGMSYFLLAACFLMEIAVVCARQGTEPVIHPVIAGPRYFFFPYVTLAWLLVQWIDLDYKYLRFIGIGLLCLMVANFWRIPPRHHDAIDWRAHIENCQQIDNYSLPFHFKGKENAMGKAITTTAECRYLVSHSLFDNRITETPKATP